MKDYFYNQRIQSNVSQVNYLFQEHLSTKVVDKSSFNHIHFQDKTSLEKSIHLYLNDIIEIYCGATSVIQSVVSDDSFIFEDYPSFEKVSLSMELNRDQLISYRNHLNDLLTVSRKLSYVEQNNVQLYQKFLQDLNYSILQSYVYEINAEIVNLNSDLSVFDYLSSHKDSWHMLDRHIEFLKQSVFEDFSLLSKTERLQRLEFQLIEDTVPPQIQADDKTIYLYGEINLSDSIFCYDEVDEEVECSIEGEYNNQVAGDYPILIRSTDKSNNESTKTIYVHVINRPSKPYSIDVIRNQNIVIVYGLDDYGNYSRIVRVFTCSTGRDNATPVGTFQTTKGGLWGSLFGGVWGQYTTRIVGDILFHSVPYYSPNKGDLEWEEYNKLGTQASLGCVRLAVSDVKWIYYNCPSGTTVHIYDGDIPAGAWKPSSIHIDGSNPNRGWDPTDDDGNNPWNYS